MNPVTFVRTFTLALIALSGALLAGGTAGAAQERDKLTVSTSLGPISGDDERDLRARGRAPRGSKVAVRFYRGSARIGTDRPKLSGDRYAAEQEIDRTGEYRVRVTATTPGGKELRVTARLNYGPTAEAPSAPE